jgi:hypothetical protein
MDPDSAAFYFQPWRARTARRAGFKMTTAISGAARRRKSACSLDLMTMRRREPDGRHAPLSPVAQVAPEEVVARLLRISSIIIGISGRISSSSSCRKSVCDHRRNVQSA